MKKKFKQTECQKKNFLPHSKVSAKRIQAHNRVGAKKNSSAQQGKCENKFKRTACEKQNSNAQQARCALIYFALPLLYPYHQHRGNWSSPATPYLRRYSCPVPP